ncbi:fibronectin type III domain-containing protein [Thecamonas trahens ATCC 50062]|uniref:Fibronectin type III domain-containing protein n=1 Tax=Thecamonas trahens ATCC 50062 TaxID=461836 RepID=A0A0L0DLW3_THETB|nr:fibronectin type III domain-containing protein [Thecamonas trahens ATCC 50062]KNC52378.1 fibronectin type III domain-containing protein [Thecamonas trahens ATCC 50062]|eukprot:XP_013755425.1 fibronectin type III domain-containing protein [Thecamonas trahens ATCC 50062]
MCWVLGALLAVVVAAEVGIPDACLAADGIYPRHTILDSASGGADLVLYVDVDSNGRDDVVVAMASAGMLVVYAPAKTVVDVGVTGVAAMAVADVDADADVDIVLALAAELRWYANNGDGSFAPSALVSSAVAGADSIAIADLDGDGRPDLAAAASGPGSVVWLRATGPLGIFAAPATVATFQLGVRALAAVDADGDGDVDLAAAVVGSNAVVWFDNADSSFTPRTVAGGLVGLAPALATGDINNDGRPDFVAAHAGRVVWIASRSTSGWLAPAAMVTGTPGVVSLAVHDVNLDGFHDVVFASDARAAWVPTAADGGWLGPQQNVTDSLTAIRALAVSSAGGAETGTRMAVATGNTVDAVVEYVPRAANASLRRLETVHSNSGYLSDLTTADLNGDSYLDLISAVAGGGVVWYPNLAGTFGAQIQIAGTVDRSRRVRVGDMDGDGDLDLVVTSSGSDFSPGKVAWFENLDGKGSFPIESIVLSGVLTSPQALDLGDIDGDGDLDIGVTSLKDEYNSASEQVAWIENRLREPQADFAPPVIIEDPVDSANNLVLADLDGDGTVDMAVACTAAASGTRMYLNTNGDGSAWSFVQLAPAYGYSVAIFVADMNRDSLVDLVLRASDLIWLENGGSGNFSTIHTISLAPPSSVNLVDYDHDGDLDVLGDVRFDDFGWYENLNGLGSVWSAKQILYSSSLTLDTALTFDVDFDGDWDIVIVESDVGADLNMLRGDVRSALTPLATTTDMREMARLSSICRTVPLTMACVHHQASMAMSACAASTLVLPVGVYTGCRKDSHVTISGLFLTMAASGEAGAVTFDCNAAGGVLYTVSDGGALTLNGMNIYDTTTGSIGAQSSPGLRVVGSRSMLKLKDAQMVRCAAGLQLDSREVTDAGRGGAIVVADGALLVAENVRFTQSSAANAGGAIFARDAGTRVSLLATTIELSSAGSNGGGVAVVDGARIEADAASVIRSNVAGGSGGGLYTLNASCELVGTSMVANTAGPLQLGGGAALISPLSESSLAGLVIGGNDAGFGGALAVVSAEVETALAGARSTLDLPWLDASYATAALGNAVKVTVDDVQMTGNVGRAAGGGMFACGIAAAITGSSSSWSNAESDGWVCAVDSLAATPSRTESSALPWLRMDDAGFAALAQAYITGSLAELRWAEAPATLIEPGLPAVGVLGGVDWLGSAMRNKAITPVWQFEVPESVIMPAAVTVPLVADFNTAPEVVAQVRLSQAGNIPAAVRWQVDAGSSSTVAPLVGVFNITVCGPGSGGVVVQRAGAEPVVVCAPCGAGLRSPSEGGLAGCVPLAECPIHTLRVAATTNSTARCECKVGFWTAVAKYDVACEACPVGALCSGGLGQPQAAPGFFPDASNPGLFISCPQPSACTGSGQCAAGYTSRLCAQCADGYYRMGGSCRKCSSGRTGVVVLLLLIGAAGVTAVLIGFNLAEAINYKFASVMIGLNALQISAIFGQLQLDWGTFATTYFDVASAMNVDFALASPECSSAGGTDVWVLKLWLTLLLPVFAACMVAAVGVGYAGVIKARLTPLRTRTMAALVSACGRSLFQLVVLLYLPLTAAAFSVFGCYRDESGRWVLAADPARTCFTSAWWGGLFVPGLLFVCVYAIGIPSLVVYVLYTQRQRLDEIAYVLKFGFLVGRFERDKWWYEAMIMARKVGVVICMTFFSTQPGKANAAVLVLAASLAHVMLSSPYGCALHNHAAMVVLAATTLVLYAGTFRDFALRRTGVIMGVIVTIIAMVTGSILDLWRLRLEEKEADDEFYTDGVFRMDQGETESPTSSAVTMTSVDLGIAGNGKIHTAQVGTEFGVDSIGSLATARTAWHRQI